MSKGIIYILLAVLAFAIMNAMAKQLSGLHPMQIVFLRAFGTFVFIFPYMLWHRVPVVGENVGMLVARALVGIVSLATFFICLQRIPLASAVSMRYLGPVFGAIMAFYFLKEKINSWQWLSFLISFSGVLVIKGFDLRIDYLSLILILTSALFLGTVFVIIRYLSTREHYLTIINYFMVVSMLLGLCFVNRWRMPVGDEWPAVLGIGVFGLIGQVFMTKAYQLVEASVLAPFKYAGLIYALFIGYFFFKETFTLLPLIGIALIVLGMLLNIYGKRKSISRSSA
ncbi:MAG: DMT family transporter [Bacteroidota bacterium]